MGMWGALGQPERPCKRRFSQSQGHATLTMLALGHLELKACTALDVQNAMPEFENCTMQELLNLKARFLEAKACTEVHQEFLDKFDVTFFRSLGQIILGEYE